MKWRKKHSYNFNQDKALDIYASACGHFSVMPKTDTAKLLVAQAVSQLRAASAALAALRNEMQSLAASLPECPVMMGMFGVDLVCYTLFCDLQKILNFFNFRLDFC